MEKNLLTQQKKFDWQIWVSCFNFYNIQKREKLKKKRTPIQLNTILIFSIKFSGGFCAFFVVFIRAWCWWESIDLMIVMTLTFTWLIVSMAFYFGLYFFFLISRTAWGESVRIFRKMTTIVKIIFVGQTNWFGINSIKSIELKMNIDFNSHFIAFFEWIRKVDSSTVLMRKGAVLSENESYYFWWIKKITFQWPDTIKMEGSSDSLQQKHRQTTDISVDENLAPNQKNVRFWTESKYEIKGTQNSKWFPMEWLVWYEATNKQSTSIRRLSRILTSLNRNSWVIYFTKFYEKRVNKKKKKTTASLSISRVCHHCKKKNRNSKYIFYW